MEEDSGGSGPSEWLTGPLEADAMDLREAGASGPAAGAGPGLTKKEKQGKRGARTRNQKVGVGVCQSSWSN